MRAAVLRDGRRLLDRLLAQGRHWLLGASSRGASRGTRGSSRPGRVGRPLQYEPRPQCGSAPDGVHFIDAPCPAAGEKSSPRAGRGSQPSSLSALSLPARDSLNLVNSVDVVIAGQDERIHLIDLVLTTSTADADEPAFEDKVSDILGRRSGFIAGTKS